MQSIIRLSFDAGNLAQLIKELMSIKKGMILELKTKFADIEQTLCIQSTGDHEEVRRAVCSWLEMQEMYGKEINKEVKPS